MRLFIEFGIFNNIDQRLSKGKKLLIILKKSSNYTSYKVHIDNTQITNTKHKQCFRCDCFLLFQMSPQRKQSHQTNERTHNTIQYTLQHKYKVACIKTVQYKVAYI